MKNETAWLHWAMGSARSWRDISSLVPETGIDMVDADHRILLEFAVDLNLLAERSSLGFSEELLNRQREILKALREYTKFHFEREERLIETIHAPNLELQKSEHARIIQSLDDRSQDFESGRLSISPELRRSIFSWIVDHISGTDWKTFQLANLEGAFLSARSWSDIRSIIRSTGVDSLDSQHRALINAILALSSSLRASADPKILRARLKTLQEITVDHFEYEEKFFEKFNVSGLDKQHATHASFIARLRDFGSRLSSPRFEYSEGVPFTHEILIWLADHVNGLDYTDLRRNDWMVKAFETMPSEELLPLVRATGIAQVDSEHQEFVHKATAFGDAVKNCNQGSLNTILKLFDDLLEFAERHFKSEERIFPEDSRLRSQRHLEEHRTILETLKAYRTRLAEGRIGAAISSRSMVLRWWVNHTNGTDIDTLGSAAFDREPHDEQ